MRRLWLLLFLVGTMPVLAADSSNVLTGFSLVWQQYNRCATAALTIQLSYFDWDGRYDQVIAALNPHEEDVSVRMDEMAAFAEAQGLGAVVRTGGTLDTVRALIDAGFPLLVENVHYEGPNDWMSHNWVIVGYDDDAGAVLAFDPRLGAGPDLTGRPVLYDEFDTHWQPFNRNYLVLYHPDDEAALMAALGDDGDITANAERTLAQAEAEFDADNTDAFALFNMASALVDLGDYEQAAALYDDALSRELPWRMLWYQFGPFEAYLQTGRYDDVIALAQGVNATTPGVEEMYYYTGRAYAGLGDTARAADFFEVALFRNRHYTAAETALAELEG